MCILPDVEEGGKRKFCRFLTVLAHRMGVVLWWRVTGGPAVGSCAAAGADSPVAQAEGECRLLLGAVCGSGSPEQKEVRDLVEEAFAHRSRQWLRWRGNLEKISQPDAAVRIAELILKETGDTAGTSGHVRLFQAPKGPQEGAAPGLHRVSRVQLCDFHIHTNYSDGRLTLPEVIDFYGRADSTASVSPITWPIPGG